MDAIISRANQGANLTTQLLGFARGGKYQPVPLNMNDTIRETVNVSEKIFEKNITVHYDFEEPLPAAKADKNQMHQVLTNLVINANDAMPDGGTLTITTRNVQVDETFTDAHPEVVPGDYVLLEISDTGSGIAPDMLEKVIEPFFSTKSTGHGTGLGLSMVYGFAKQTGGHISIYSEIGHGTTIRLYLPRAGVGDIEVTTEDYGGTGTEGGNERVLVVEDNASLRETVVAQLEVLGYQVIERDGPQTALEVLRSEAVIDLLLSDIVMPGDLSGYDLVAEGMKLRPGLRVLLTSGFSDEMVSRNGKTPPGVQFLAKPYRFQDLARMVRKTLEQDKREKNA
ncbi:MAG: response regulator [Alphaproteobacteria bacterium]|nr:response regulator [Alphaproteobacteria bacterium]